MLPKPLCHQPVNLSVLKYDVEDTVAGANRAEATLSDWNRWADSKHLCQYYINGVKLSDLCGDMKEKHLGVQKYFKTIDALKVFFKDYLFKDIQSEEQRGAAAEKACLHFHQAGIQNATFNDFEHKVPNIVFNQPETKIHFNSDPSGVVIIEEHFIKQWWENNTIEHKSDEYCVTTETTYLFKPNEITLEDMRIDCRDPALKPVFKEYVQETPAEDYRHTLTRLVKSLDYELYYPQDELQQNAILKECRNCFYIDNNTKKMVYINAYGTGTSVQNTPLSSTVLERPVNQPVAIQFNFPNSNRSLQISVPHSFSNDCGYFLKMTQAKMRLLIPENFETDRLFKYGDNLLRELQRDQTLISRLSSLFGSDTTQERRAILAIVKQFTTTKPALTIRKYRQKPAAMTFYGKGESVYVFVANEKDPDKSRFWFVDRSENIPEWVEFPMNLDQAIQLHTLFGGAQQFAAHKPTKTDPDFNRDIAWYELGEHAKIINHTDDSMSVTLMPDTAKKVVDLMVSPLPLGENLVEDWTYNEAFDALTNTIKTAEVSLDNEQLIKRCRKIQDLLRDFGDNFDCYFPKTRGIVPYDKRINVLKMLNDILARPDSPEAKHYFRNRHRVYKEPFDTDKPKQYERSSFVWSNQSLLYIRMDGIAEAVPMTTAIQKALDSDYISAEEVYHLMTRPRLFQYFYGIPVGLNCQAFEFKYCIPVGFDRSKGLHTGTAQEMMLEIRDIHLSLKTLLLKLFEFFLFIVLPAILQGFGIAFPLAWLGLTAIELSIVNWFSLIWSVSSFYSLLSWVGVGNLLVRPEFNALDKALDELSVNLNTPPINKDSNSIDNNFDSLPEPHL